VRRIILLVVAGLVCTPLVASAQLDAYGFRGGIGIDPDQFNFGGQLRVGPFAPDFFFVPNLEIGVGSDLAIYQFNFDIDYMIKNNSGTLDPYVGGGLALALVDPDDDRFGNANSSTEVGVNFIGGLAFPSKSGATAFFTELRLGVGDIPDFKAMVGWNFGAN
jgi:hypothetical protein